MRDDLYKSVKTGIKRDVYGAGVNLAGALGFFFFVLFLLMMIWVVVAPNSTASEGGRIFALIILILVIPCLFFRRTANFIINLWGILCVVVVGLAILIPVGYLVIMFLGIGFGFIPDSGASPP